ncbi:MULTISPECIES: hypothetical protein [Clostridia]|nr:MULTISPECIES: hypothetical protein [Clostridia]
MNLQVPLMLMGQGMGAIFVVVLAIFLLTWLLVKMSGKASK